MNCDGNLDAHVRPPNINEDIMVRLPFDVLRGPPSIISGAALSQATSWNCHLCFVAERFTIASPMPSIQLKLWVCLGFSSAVPSSHAFVQSLPAEWRECLLPVPFGPQATPQLPMVTPTAFGLPLQLSGFITRLIFVIPLTAGIPMR